MLKPHQCWQSNPPPLDPLWGGETMTTAPNQVVVVEAVAVDKIPLLAEVAAQVVPVEVLEVGLVVPVVQAQLPWLGWVLLPTPNGSPT